ncbi:hypothetical protein DPMN_180222 [Dreissena polymorpha]|uniref:Uncharacterized protein n=1 Tax=Dreissena polymorpha TaxID=45954 RepID=A0A9D4EHR2_DREPO|nr:hypothetical protein DPMN_180222 [Dreissena polymorpha]
MARRLHYIHFNREPTLDPTGFLLHKILFTENPEMDEVLRLMDEVLRLSGASDDSAITAIVVEA